MSSSARKLIKMPSDSGRDDERMDLPAEYPALFKTKLEGIVVDGVMVNISNTGIGIRTSRAINLNTEINFITLERTIAFKVIWCTADPQVTGYRVGLELSRGSENLTKTFRWMWERWALEQI